MNNQIIIFFVAWVLMSALSFWLRLIVINIAEKAIAEKKLRTGIYYFFPIEGEKAVELANGYISGIKIFFWFGILFIPFIFILAVINGNI